MNALIQKVKQVVRTGATQVTFRAAPTSERVGHAGALPGIPAVEQLILDLPAHRPEQHRQRQPHARSYRPCHRQHPRDSGTPSKPPLPWTPTDNGDGSVTLNQKSHLYDLGGVALLTINNLEDNFDVSIGDILYLKVPLLSPPGALDTGARSSCFLFPMERMIFRITRSTSTTPIRRIPTNNIFM